jgi:hypothetical protein
MFMTSPRTPGKRFAPRRAAEGQRAADLAQPVVAFRSWRVVDGRLRSPSAPFFWDEAVAHATCTPPGEHGLAEEHPAPSAGCGCGIHARLEPDAEQAKVDHRGVTGIVTIWGRVQLQDGSVRAEHAKVEALAMYPRWTRRQKEAVYDLAEELDVEIVALEEVEEAAARFGKRLAELPAHALEAPVSSVAEAQEAPSRGA